MKILTFRLELVEPLMATAPGGDPNSETTSDFIPGSMLRGALIARYAAASATGTSGKGPANLDAGDPEFARLFLDGTTRYLNGYPIEGQGRTIPTPLSWQRPKDQEDTACDFAVRPITDENENKKQWQPINTPFCQLRIEEDAEENVLEATVVRPSHTITVHTSRDRRYGRARSGSGAVYQYESLEAGQSFQAAIICEYDSDAERLRELLGERLQLGGSRSGGYGGVQVVKPKILDGTNWHEHEISGCESEPRTFSITLLSDVILRDGRGQYTIGAEVVAETISPILGRVKLRVLPEHTFIRGTLIGGFNRKWGLPLTQTPALRMGSVIVFKIEGDDEPTEEQFAHLESRGIGERRAEGFGRLGINLHGNKEIKIGKSEESGDKDPVTVGDPESVKIARRIVIRLLRRCLDDAVARRANQLGIHINTPSRSQLSRLRLIIREALGKDPAKGRPLLTTYFDSLEDRLVTRSQFTRDRVDNDSTIDWLRRRVNDTLGGDFLPGKSLPKLGSNITASMTPELIYEYNLRLIDAVLMRAAKNRGSN